MKTIIYLILLHSIWQGIALAALTGLTMLLARRSAPAVRYRLLVGLLVLFVGGMMLKIMSVVPHPGNYQQQTVTTDDGQKIMSSITRLDLGGAGIASYLNEHSDLIVWLWLIIVCFKSIRLAAGLRIAYQMKRQQVYEAGFYWQDRVKELADRLGINQQVRIMQSALAKTPLVIGHLKPLILMPLGLMNNLSSAEVEAILCHELAHIRRKDFLVNLLQSMLDVVFFFNPAVLWINKLIREEREHCCDDLALGASVGIRDYVSALISSQTAKTYYTGYALAFAGSRNELLSRVNRILQQKDKRKPFRIAVIVMLLSAGTALAFLRKDGTHIRTITYTTSISNKEGVTKTEQIVKENIAAANYKVCKPGINSPIEQFAPAAPAPPAEPAAIQEQAKQDAQQAEADAAKAIADQARAQQEAQEYHRRADNYEEFTEQDGRNLREELARDGLITNGKAEQISYLLNNKELIVNDVKQPEAIHQKYAARYVKYPGRSILYNYEYTSAH